MKKLLLNLETLNVQSFDTTTEKDRLRGTVVSAESELGTCNVYCSFNCPFTASCGGGPSCTCPPPSGYRACLNPD